MKTSIVLGMGYGDEGKGLTTHRLAAQARAAGGRCLVVRFCGGQQAGHTVVLADGRRHVFSSIGSGSFCGADTLVSRYCTFYPLGMLRELEVLKQSGIAPHVYIDPLAMMTTPYDVVANMLSQRGNNTVGAGVGKTMDRNTTPYKLYYKDLADKGIFMARLHAVRDYYYNRMPAVAEHPRLQEWLAEFLHACDMMPARGISLMYEHEMAEKYEHIIFEGAQGILLDMDHGVFPQVTYAHTTSRNAMEIIARNHLPQPHIHYVTRCYATRHGDGYFAHEATLPLTGNSLETNVENKYQGVFRTGYLSLDTLRYALHTDMAYSGPADKTLVITCLDQWPHFEVVKNGMKLRMNAAGLAGELGFEKWEESWGETGVNKDF